MEIQVKVYEIFAFLESVFTVKAISSSIVISPVGCVRLFQQNNRTFKVGNKYIHNSSDSNTYFVLVLMHNDEFGIRSQKHC